jgi:HEAT repeat protein
VRLPARPEERLSPRELLGWLESHLGTAAAAQLCADVLAADDPHDQAEAVLLLGGDAGRSILEDGTSWKPYWARVWGARGLLYVWDDAVSPVVLERLADEHWRVAEMCLKVSVLRALPCGDDAVRLAGHELPRVRSAAVRALGVGGDVEHLHAVHELLDDPDEDVRKAAARALERAEARLDI